jgi:hypothetical protein
MAEAGAGEDPQQIIERAIAQTKGVSPNFGDWQNVNGNSDGVTARVALQNAGHRMAKALRSARIVESIPGGDCDVDIVQAPNGLVVVRHPKEAALQNPQTKVMFIEERLGCLLSGRGITPYEQVQGIQYSTGDIYTSHIPGKDVRHLTPEELKAIGDRHLKQLGELVCAVSDCGIQIDPIGENTPCDVANDNQFGLYDAHKLINPNDALKKNSDAIISVLRSAGSGLPRAQAAQAELLTKSLVTRLVKLTPRLAKAVGL